jgi:hypothetical protein
MYTTVGSSQNGRAASSTQTNGGAPHQSPLRTPSPLQVMCGDAELDQIQVQDWDEEAEKIKAAAEEEELIKVQHEIEMLRQEQESIMRHQAVAQCVEAWRHHINSERARLTELQYTIDVLRQQEQHQQPNANPPSPNYPIPPLPPPFNDILHNRLPSLPHNQYFPPPSPPPPHLGTTDPKSTLAHHLRLTPWPPHYQATPPPKYHGNVDPRKFLMSYEVATASAGGDEATLAKFLIISLKDTMANWYSRLPPGCIYS